MKILLSEEQYSRLVEDTFKWDVEEVKKLIAGPSVYICNECIKLCGEIVEDEEKEKKAKYFFEHFWSFLENKWINKELNLIDSISLSKTEITTDMKSLLQNISEISKVNKLEIELQIQYTFKQTY